MSEKKQFKIESPLKEILIFLVIATFLTFMAMTGDETEEMNSPDIMTEERYYQEIYPNTHESYEQYIKDKEFIRDLYEESEKIKERGY